MSYNNEYLVEALASINITPDPDSPDSIPSASSSRDPHPIQLPSPRSPTLIHTLPSSSQINSESQLASHQELLRQSKELEREKEAAEAKRESEREEQKKNVKESNGTWANLIAGRRKGKEKEKIDYGNIKTHPFERPPNAYELYAAIDNKDIVFIMRVRDHAFPLLLQKNAGEFPIVYASRIGPSHRDIAILICGALSRYVNHLEEIDFKKKETLTILRMLRINLKIAIDNSLLPASDPSLLSSYLQVLIMSEGDKWVLNAVQEVSLLLRTSSPPLATTTSTPSTKPPPLSRSTSLPTMGPVQKAQTMMQDFCTKELRNVEGGNVGVEQYIANAVMDLVLMAGWSLVVGHVGGELLPTYTFARDQRTYSLFVEALSTISHKSRSITSNTTDPDIPDLTNKLGKRLKGQIDVLVEVCGDTKLSIQTRVGLLKGRL